MWYDVFLTLLMLSAGVVWVGRFISGILRTASCVFFVSLHLAATLWQMTSGPVSHSLPLVWRQDDDDGSSHHVARGHVDQVSVGLSFTPPRLCFNILHLNGNWFSRISLVKICIKLILFSKKEKRTMFVMLARENVFIHVKISYIQNKSLWLLSVALLVGSWLRSFSCKISGGFSPQWIRFLLPSSVILPTDISHPNVCENEKEAPWACSPSVSPISETDAWPKSTVSRERNSGGVVQPHLSATLNLAQGHVH